MEMILIESRHWLRRNVKRALGRALLLVRPDIERRILSGGEVRSSTERLAVAGLIARHSAAGTLDKLAHLHSGYWAGADAVAYHGTNEDRFHSRFLKLHYEIVDALEEVVSGGRIHTLCEIGCGSGQVIDHLAKRLPTLKRLVGIDLSASQIAINEKRYRDSRLGFVAADGAQWLQQHSAPGFCFLTYGGVLEYFPQELVQRMFATLARRGPACFALVEPTDPAHDLDREMNSRIWGEEFTFSHNYAGLLADAGFHIRWRRELVTGYRWQMVVATVGDTQ
jgi:SAM-dependent methyltransferase